MHNEQKVVHTGFRVLQKKGEKLATVIVGQFSPEKRPLKTCKSLKKSEKKYFKNRFCVLMKKFPKIFRRLITLLLCHVSQARETEEN